MGFMDNLLNAIRNKYLNATGAERDLLTNTYAESRYGGFAGDSGI